MPHPWGLNIRDEVSGGLVSAAVAIPLAMGYGMFAFVSLGDKYFAYGALAYQGENLGVCFFACCSLCVDNA
ncbi:hypothetical protein [Methyloceanibacter sp.]|uniref:hypothetical protein n=1 Tax=Methyloceanibacter sp. TaxID=1965321 RepID=UPI003C729B37